MSFVANNPHLSIPVPKLAKALQQFEEKQASKIFETIGNVFVKHNAWNDFGLSLAHRHFDLSPEEVSVLCINKDANIGVITPWIYKEELAFPPEIRIPKLSQPEAEIAFEPLSWHFIQSREAIPYEFLFMEDANDPLPPLHQEFADDILLELKQHGLDTIFGLRRIIDIQNNSVWGTKVPGMRVHECVLSEEEPRRSTGKKVVQVAWRFGQDGLLQAGGVMCFHGEDDDDDDGDE